MPDILWNPLVRQEREADTLFLFDADEQKNIPPDKGGFLQSNSYRRSILPWGDCVKIIPGRFRSGVASIHLDYHGAIFMPSDGLLPANEWTIEFWLKHDADYPGNPNVVPMEWVFGDRGRLRFTTSPGNVGLEYVHYQTPNATPYEVRIETNTRASLWAGGAWVSIAATLKNKTLTLFINGATAAQTSGVAHARIHGCQAIHDGFWMVGSRFFSSAGIHVSDLRISRFARVPNQSVTLPALPTLTINGAATGKIVNYTLLGALHSVGNTRTEELTQDSLRVFRTDKLINSTPIVAGQPDAEHPTPGVSGLYSYDWQVVDRTLAYYARLNAIPYISIDSTPQILGGATPPYSGMQLATYIARFADYNKEVPNDFDAFATIVYDLVHYCVVEKNAPITYWGFWNEPDYYLYWGGTRAQFFDLYALCARAVKRVSPHLKIGGPEVGTLDWVENFLEYCGTNNVPVDFISFHFYMGDLGDFAFAPTYFAEYARNHGISNPIEFINGECCWEVYNFPGGPLPPFSSLNYFVNDWHAAWIGTALLQEQASDVVYHIYTNGVSDGGYGFDATGLVSSEHSWANNNVFRLWAKMQPRILQSDFAGGGDMHALASRAASGDDLTVFMSRLRFAPEAAAPVLVQSGAAFYRYARVRHYVVDDMHSNYFDSGADHAELEMVETLWAEPGGGVRFSLRARSVHLLAWEIDGLMPVNVTASVTVTRGGLRYDRPTGRYLQQITLANKGASPLAAPPDNGPPLLTLTLSGLGNGVALANATGTTSALPPGISVGIPYIDVPLPTTGLALGASVSVVLQFSGTNTAGMNFSAAIWAGPGKRA